MNWTMEKSERWGLRSLRNTQEGVMEISYKMNTFMLDDGDLDLD